MIPTPILTPIRMLYSEKEGAVTTDDSCGGAGANGGECRGGGAGANGGGCRGGGAG